MRFSPVLTWTSAETKNVIAQIYIFGGGNPLTPRSVPIFSSLTQIFPSCGHIRTRNISFYKHGMVTNLIGNTRLWSTFLSIDPVFTSVHRVSASYEDCASTFSNIRGNSRIFPIGETFFYMKILAWCEKALNLTELGSFQNVTYSPKVIICHNMWAVRQHASFWKSDWTLLILQTRPWSKTESRWVVRALKFKASF